MSRAFGQTSLVLPIALCVMLAASLPARAAQLSMTRNGAIYIFYVDGESLNGGFETIYFQAKATPPGKFANVPNGAAPPGVPRPPGDSFTYPNRMLIADPLDFPGALGLSMVGFINNGQELSYAVGNLFGTITTANQPNGDLFLANLYVPDPTHFTATVQLISAGTVVFEATQTIPEPAAGLVALVGLSSLLAFRRHFG
ncbi:MAG: hypothetical protein JNL18_21570 [Planctomycetaceae bacterium]|nr:hypothetical protein [Planctomycetaceae bacterium]